MEAGKERLAMDSVRDATRHEVELRNPNLPFTASRSFWRLEKAGALPCPVHEHVGLT